MECWCVKSQRCSHKTKEKSCTQKDGTRKHINFTYILGHHIWHIHLNSNSHGRNEGMRAAAPCARAKVHFSPADTSAHLHILYRKHKRFLSRLIDTPVVNARGSGYANLLLTHPETHNGRYFSQGFLQETHFPETDLAIKPESPARTQQENRTNSQEKTRKTRKEFEKIYFPQQPHKKKQGSPKNSGEATREETGNTGEN